MAATEKKRQVTTRTLAWFVDLLRRAAIDLDPPYQRRSVWNQMFKDYFIETLLLELPSPAIFLYEEISEDGALSYSVVDGKQRLSTIFEFVDDEFPVSEKSKIERLRGLYFSKLDPETRKQFFSYEVPLELVTLKDEAFLNDIFDRINRNVSRLTPQELRHARFGGVFAQAIEELTDEMAGRLPPHFPNIAESSKRQMKDAEFVALLILLVEKGPESTPQEYLDRVYAERDEDWPSRRGVVSRFRRALDVVGQIADEGGATLVGTRLRNQGDFYALFGAISELQQRRSLPDPAAAADRLRKFLALVVDDKKRVKSNAASAYYEAARSAANDPSRRRVRIERLREAIES